MKKLKENELANGKFARTGCVCLTNGLLGSIQSSGPEVELRSCYASRIPLIVWSVRHLLFLIDVQNGDDHAPVLSSCLPSLWESDNCCSRSGSLIALEFFFSPLHWCDQLQASQFWNRFFRPAACLIYI